METIVAPRIPADSPELATAIRSTMLQSSLRAIEELGRLDDYYRALPTEHHALVRELVVGQWIPMDVGMAHYGAIETLRLSRDQAYMNGRVVADRVQKSWAMTVVRTLGAGMNPWSALSRLQSAWDRLIQGGSAAVYKLGPKDAQLEMLGCPLARYDYVRYGWTGMMSSTLELFTTKARSNVVVPKCTATRAVFVVSWV